MRDYPEIEERFDHSANEAIQTAEAESLSLGHFLIGSELLLLGLTGQRTTASKALSNSGFHLKRGRREVQRALGQGSGLRLRWFLKSAKLDKILESSAQEADRRNEKLISAEHLLMALLNEIIESQEGTALEVLNQMDIDPVTIKKNLLELTEL